MHVPEPVPIVELSDVEHGFIRDVSVVRNLNLAVKPGARSAVVGPSGTGKTTLLGILGLLIRPRSGTVRFDGETIDGERQSEDARRQSIAWILQTTNVFGDRTIRENAALGLVARGVPQETAFEVVTQSLKSVGLGDIVDQRARYASGGELQRLSVARALSVQPRLLLADEPTASLDADNALLVIDLLFQLATESTAIVLATHDQRCVTACNEVLTLEHGSLLLTTNESA